MLSKVDNLLSPSSVELIGKNLLFLDIFMRNRLNLIIVHQIRGFASLFELLKYYSNQPVQKDLDLDKITMMIINCISLCLRNDIIGFDFLNAESGQKDFKYL